MAEITEETLVQHLCDPKRFEDALLEIKTTLDTVAGSAVVHEAFRRLHATIAERDGQIAALVAVVKRYHEALPSPESTTILANLPAAAKAHDERLEAEGAAEALRLLPCLCRAVGTNSEDAAVITCQRCFALSGYKSEAARLREEAGR